jgi:histidinol-phosphate aminotransferase
MRKGVRQLQSLCKSFAMANRTASDYKDDGTNILLDANENAYGPGLALDKDGKLSHATVNGTSGAVPAIDVDLLGLNRYPDP